MSADAVSRRIAPGAGSRPAIAAPERIGSPAVVLHRLGKGRPTLVLHGGGPGCTSRNDFAAVLDRLMPGRSLLLVDLPQFGGADAPRVTGPVFDFHAAVLARLLDAMSLRRVDVIAQSLGGSVALQLAALRPGLVRRIVATGSQPVPFARPQDPRTGAGLRARERYYGGRGPTREKMRELIAGLEWHDQRRIPDELVDRRYADSILDGPRTFGLDQDGRGMPQDLSDHLAAVTAGVLLIWGERDPFSSPDYAHALARRLPRARAEVIPAAAHHPQSEHPQRYAALVEQFLSDTEPWEHS